MSLRDRRRRARKLWVIAACILLIALIAGAIYLLWRPELRIHDVSIQGFDAASLDPLIKEPLTGTYMRILPRDSIFFFPAENIRSNILDAYPDIAAVSISRTGFSSINVRTIERVSAFDWCGPAPDEAAPCYETDAEGFIFAQSTDAILLDGASTTPSGTLRIYAPLTASSTNDTPLRAHVDHPEIIPGVLTFERAMATLGADVVSVALRGDEADLYLRGGTRLTYVVGQEEKAAQLAAAVFPQLNLNDGSIDYVDLRFEGKVYFKKTNE